MATVGITSHRTRISAGSRGGTAARAAQAAIAPPGAARRRRHNPAEALSMRVLYILLGMLVLYVLLASRLFYIQVMRHGAYDALAESLRDKQVLIQARRGELLDRNGILLVRNEPTVDIIVDPNAWHHALGKGETAESRQATVLASLAALTPGADVAGAVATHGITFLPDKKRWRPITVAERQEPSVGDTIKKAKLLGVGVLQSARRVAIDGNLAPHVIGFTGRDGAGLDGLENGLNGSLKGENGILKAEFDVRGRTIPGTVRTDKPAEHGNDVMLTLDAGIQNIVQDALGKAFTKHHAEAATAVVLDPKTGDILACANYPAYDVNNRLGSDGASRVNRAVSAPYEPGSTLKIVTVGAALEEKKVTPTTMFQCNGSMPVGKRTIHCHLDNAFPHGHGDETLEDVIIHSCNVATAECAFRLGKEKLYQYETAFGFGQKTGAGLPGESRGLLKTGGWSDIQLANIGFGQGISVTPLQLTAAYGAIANDGVYQRPRIVRGIRDDATQSLKPSALEAGRRVLSPETARELRKMLQAVVDRGTGKNAQLNGYTSGGKTGTAQIAEGGRYSGKFVASFIGMAPMNDPRYVILVSVTDPKDGHFGAEVSAPVFHDIAESVLLRERVPHDKAMNVKSAKPSGNFKITHDD